MEGMPTQCIDTARALVNVYGKERAEKYIQSNIESLSEAYKCMKSISNPIDSLKIASQSDFWTQCLHSIQNAYTGTTGAS